MTELLTRNQFDELPLDDQIEYLRSVDSDLWYVIRDRFEIFSGNDSYAFDEYINDNLHENSEDWEAILNQLSEVKDVWQNCGYDDYIYNDSYDDYWYSWHELEDMSGIVDFFVDRQEYEEAFKHEVELSFDDFEEVI